ncbi:MAG: nucleoside-diphosphate kinase [Candidatus Zambryskibacteria bacterium]|nr:nucleoside-diphosphate kinase [Candidatus Zambryskibacteria bacterium]
MQHPKEEITFLMVKTDGVRKGLIGETIKRVEQRGLKIVALEMFHATREEADSHYPKDDVWLKRLGGKTLTTYEKYGRDPKADMGTNDALKLGKKIRGWLIDYLTDAPMVKMIIQGVHAIDMVRKIVGNTLPYKAEMGTIRGDFSVDSPALANKEQRAIFNLVHASETAEEAKHEIEFWFKNHPIFQYKRFGVDD